MRTIACALSVSILFFWSRVFRVCRSGVLGVDLGIQGFQVCGAEGFEVWGVWVFSSFLVLRFENASGYLRFEGLRYLRLLCVSMCSILC